MSKSINDLREAMFDTLAALKSGKISVEQARAASQIGGVLIESAKVEVEFMKVSEGGGSGFFEVAERLPDGVVGITRHRIAG